MDNYDSSIIDKIVMKEMQFYGRHGALPEENLLGQPFVVTVELYMSLGLAGKTDNLQATVNYGTVYTEIKQIVEQRQYNLIEALAEAIAAHILDQYRNISQVKVEIQKPKAPIAGIFAYMGVEIIRKRLV